MFSLKNVTRKYGRSIILHGLDCSIPTNEFVFVMGPSGSGKSTFVRLLSFVEGPDEGEVELRLGDEVFSSRTAARPWPKLTTVFQRQFLWPHMTVRENILLPSRSAHTNDRQRLNDVASLFEMGAFLDRYPNEISGGEAQRSALARALMLNPNIVLIDEAHGGLDLEQQKTLNEYLLKLKATGVGLIVVTHSMEFAREFADKVIVIEHGKITEFGDRSVFSAPQSSFLKRVLS